MKEETGYTISKVIKVTPTLFYEPGLSNSNMKLVYVEIDGDSPENQFPKPNREPDEWTLQTMIFPIKGLFKTLESIITHSYNNLIFHL